MNPKPQAKPQNTKDQSLEKGLGLDDIYFTVFRHKELLITCLCLGLISAYLLRATTKPVYSSQAKLLVRYVVDRPEINPVNQGANILPGNSGIDGILSSETEILTSLDLAKVVAEKVTPERILSDGATNILDAARVISMGVVAIASRRNDVMTIVFYHPDPDVVQPVLSALIQAYLDKHMEVRQGMGFGQEYYSRQMAELRQRLASTEEEIKKLLTEAKVVSLAEAKRSYSAQIERFEGELRTAKVELYARRSVLGDVAGNAESAVPTNDPIPVEKLENYAMVLTGLDALAKRERELLLQGYREVHPQVVATRRSIEELKSKKAELEATDPELRTKEGDAAGADLVAERAQVRALAAKVEGYEELLAGIQSSAFNLLSLEPKLAELERQRDQEARNLQFVASSLDRAQADAIGGNKVTGIKIVEHPTPPISSNKKLRKKMASVLGGFVLFGIAIAALRDYVIERTIRRPADARRHLTLPFFLAIPDTTWRGCWGALKSQWKRSSLRRGGQPREGDAVATVVAPWDRNHHLCSFSEGLRERLLTYFEVNGISHKPKLVGVTSCGGGAGVTTLASGLAAALSKTGDGNVLLVDMNGSQGATHSFYKGKPGCGLADALEPDARAEALVQENLYLASMTQADGASDKDMTGRFLPARFNNIMPELKASDYDYVIFDMPPVTPTSVTPRLSSNMDLVLLVLEAERSGQQSARQAGSLLTEARANTAVVLNKCRQRVPAVLSLES